MRWRDPSDEGKGKIETGLEPNIESISFENSTVIADPRNKM